MIRNPAFIFSIFHPLPTRSFISFFLLFALIPNLILAEPACAKMFNYKLSGAMPTYSDVTFFEISPDGEYVVFRADKQQDGINELYSSPIARPSPPALPAHLSQSLVNVLSFHVSPDSTTAVYLVRRKDYTYGLYSVSLQGGALTELTPPLAVGRYIQSYQISSDSKTVVYSADQQDDNVIELYSVSIHGGTAKKLNSTLAFNEDVMSFRISPDSSKVVYTNGAELYSVPTGGGTTTKLNNTTNANITFAITPDSSMVVYLTSVSPFTEARIWSVPIDGGAINDLNNAVPAGNINIFSISPDSSRVIYLTDQVTQYLYELYSVPTGGGTVMKLSSNTMNMSVHDFIISPNSNMVVFRDINGLYSMPVSGLGSLTKLNVYPEFVTKGIGEGKYKFIPDGSRIVYLESSFWSVPVSGGTPTSLIPSSSINLMSSFKVNPDNKNVVCRISRKAGDKYEIYSVKINGTGSLTKLNGPLVANGEVSDFYQISQDGSRVIYRADQDTFGIDELYGVYDGPDSQSGLLLLTIPAIISRGHTN